MRDLTARLAVGRSHVLVQAGAGIGKSHFLRGVCAAAGERRSAAITLLESTDSGMIREHTRDSYRRIGQSALAESVDARRKSMDVNPDPPVILAIDGVGYLDASGSAWLLAHLRSGAPGVRLLAADRVIPDALRALEFEATTEWVTDEHLEATSDDVSRLLADSFPHQQTPGYVAERLRSGVGANFALLHATVRRAGSSAHPVDELVRLLDSGEVYRTMVDLAMARLSERERWIVGQVAYLPVVTSATLHALGDPDTPTRLLQAGMPMSLRPDGRLVLPAPLRHELCRACPLAKETARLVAPIYVASGYAGAAIDALLTAGDDDAAIRLAGSLGRKHIGELGPANVLGLIDRLGPLVEQHPRVRLLQAAALRQLGRIDDQERVLSLALLSASPDDPGLHRQIEAEHIAARLARGPTHELLERLDDVDRRTPPVESGTRARLITARANALAWTNDAKSQAEADLLFRQAAALWATLDDRLEHADALIGWAMYVLVPGIRYDSATRVLREAAELSRGDPFLRAQSLVFLAQVAAQLNEADVVRPAVEEARALGQAAGLGWVDAYAFLAEIHLAAFADDDAAIRRHASSALDRLGQLDGHATRLIILAETSRALAQVGDREGAEEYLDLVPSDDEQVQEARALARLTLESLHGDPQHAIAVADEIVTRRLLAPGEHWRVEVHRALALARCGRSDEARAASARADRLASDWGVEQLPDLMEPRARSRTRSLLGGNDGDGETGAGVGRIDVKVFGAFAVRAGGRVLPIPPGVPATILKLVAVMGGSVTIDVAITTLWPDVPTDVGRRRFRNVISRAREAIGGAIERVNDTIVFSTDVTIDASQFDESYQTVQRLRTRDPQQAAAVARAALTGYDTLLVEDLYEDWAADARALMRQRAAALIDVVVSAGIDAATGAWLADLAIGIDPFDDGRLIRLAGVLTECGAPTLATALLDRAAGVAADLAGE